MHIFPPFCFFRIPRYFIFAFHSEYICIKFSAPWWSQTRNCTYFWVLRIISSSSCPMSNPCIYVLFRRIMSSSAHSHCALFMLYYLTWCGCVHGDSLRYILVVNYHHLDSGQFALFPFRTQQSRTFCISKQKICRILPGWLAIVTHLYNV